MNHSAFPSIGAEPTRLLHELLTRQVELEMRNTELRHACADLEESSRRFQELYDFAPVGCFSVAADGVIRQINLMGARMLGGGVEELMGTKLKDHVSPGSRKCVMKILSDVFSEEPSEPCEVELKCGGETMILEVVATPSPNGMVCRIAAMDITGRSKARNGLESQVREHTARIRSLASELALAEEHERSRIAALIHDHLQQMLVAALLNLGMMKTRLADETIVGDLAGIENMIRDSIATTRWLTAELSPPVLHQRGLAAALRWLKSWSMEKFGLDVEVTANEDIDCGNDLGATLFRCVRELLFNVVKHSGVKSAALRMWCPSPGMVNIEVSDQGAGFDPEVVWARDGMCGGYGLSSVRERLELLGGGMRIDSAPGSGSRLTLWAPLTGSARPQCAPAGITG